MSASTFARFATLAAVVVATAAFVLPASASTAQAPKGRPSSAAIEAWSASYRAKEKAYRAHLADQARKSSLSPAAIQAWSDAYRAKWDVYQQQQLAAAQKEAGAFRFDDALIGGGIVLALVGLAAVGFSVVRSRQQPETAPSA
jgi:hypothetical protein